MTSQKFANKLRIYLDMKSMTVSQAAEKIGIKADALEYILEGKHTPLAPAVLKIQEGLGIKFRSSDFEDGDI